MRKHVLTTRKKRIASVGDTPGDGTGGRSTPLCLARFLDNREQAELLSTFAEQLTQLLLVVEAGEGCTVLPARHGDIIGPNHGCHIHLRPLLPESLRFQP